MSFSRPKVSPPRMAHQRFAGLWTRCTSPWPPFWERASFLHVQRASGPDGCRSRVESNSLIIASPRGSRRLQFQRILRDKQFIALRKNPSPYLDVIEANRTALNTQLAIVRISGQRLVATVSLIKAIGVGWDRSETIALPVTAPIPRRVRIRRRWRRVCLRSSFNPSGDRFSPQPATSPSATLAKAFRGELVPRDPNDEPA